MDNGRLVAAAMAGAAIVYGLIKRSKMIKREGTPYADPDPLARQEGNLALGVGIFMLLAVFFA